MPCYTEPHAYCGHKTSEESILCEITKPIKCLIGSMEYYRDECDKVTDMLCEILNSSEKMGTIGNYSKKYKDWWEKHKLFDEKKKK